MKLKKFIWVDYTDYIELIILVTLSWIWVEYTDHIELEYTDHIELIYWYMKLKKLIWVDYTDYWIDYPGDTDWHIEETQKGFQKEN